MSRKPDFFGVNIFDVNPQSQISVCCMDTFSDENNEHISWLALEEEIT